MAQPGTMLYFDLLDDLEDYTDEEAGQILKAILRYGVTGEVPNFSDRGMRTLWRKIQSSIDRDGGRYENAVNQRKYAAYCRKIKKTGGIPTPYDEWITADNGPITADNGPITADDFRYPTSTSTATASSTSTSSSAATTNNPSVAVVMRAYLGKINPTPSQNSIDELIGYAEKMGAECCLRAFDIALDEKKTSWSYIRGILRSKLSQGVKCIADWDAVDAQRDKHRAPVSEADKNKRVREDMERTRRIMEMEKIKEEE